MKENYWTDMARGRLSRRRVLAATGAGATAAAFLAACGGSDSGKQAATSDKSSLVTAPEDTGKDAKRGGVLKDFLQADPASFEPLNPNFTLNYTIANVYGTLLVEQPGHLKRPNATLKGDLAESWEVSPDRLTVTMKLRQGVKWHNKAPVSGRTVDADDVLFSWKRFTELAPTRSLVFNGADPNAPILSMAAADARTIVIKLKEPVIYTLGYLASFGSFSGNIIMVPKEVGSGGLDIRKDVVGFGPYELANYQPSVSATLKRNPDYYDKEWGYVDGIEQPIIQDYAQQLAQMKAGRLDFHQSIRAEDILTLKRDESRISVYATDLSADVNVITWGQLPEGKSPFVDERVRQAFSMAIDRDTWIDATYNVDKFAAAGLPQETRWNSHLIAEWDGWWVDPKGKDFGPNAKYFQFNLAEAKKLLAAAGFPNGFEFTSHYPAAPQFNTSRQMQPLNGMVQELGVKVNLDPIVDYIKSYIPVIRDGQGQFEGIGGHTVAGSTPVRVDPVSVLVAEHWPKSGVLWHGYSTSGKNDRSGDPQLNAMLEKARVEPDVEARRKLVQDMQRYLGKTMHSLNMPGGASGFNMAWPALRNFRTWRTTQFTQAYKVWLDETKRT